MQLSHKKFEINRSYQLNNNLSIGSIVRGEKAQKDNIQNVLPITIAAGNNGFSVGPMTTDDGVTVIIAPGQRWIII